MNTENNKPRKYNRDDEAFKRSAVELLLQGGKSVATIATELGTSTQSLKQWKKQLAALPATGLGQRSVGQLEEENRRLRREVGDGRFAGHHPAIGRAGHGTHTTLPDRWTAPSLRSRRPIRQSKYRQRLAQAGVVPSMSRRGNCYDNAAIRVDRSLLQPRAAPQRPRLQIPCGL